MLAVDVDLTGELGKLSVGCAQKLMNGKSDLRPSLVELVGLGGERSRTQSNNQGAKKNKKS